MTRLFTATCSCRLTRTLLALALAGTTALVLAAPPSATAHASNICSIIICPPPPALAPTISVTSNGAGTLTVTGSGFTPGGTVQITASMPPDGMGGGGTSTATVRATVAHWVCTRWSCYIVPGGTIGASVPLTFSCGGGMSDVTVRAYDVATGSWSNAVAIFPWTTC